MEQKMQEQLNMNLPPYSLFSKPLDPRKKWLVAIVTGLILAVTVAVIITLVFYMNQKNAQMAQTSDSSGAVLNVHQTFYSHNGGNLFTVFASDQNSVSVLLDYSQKLIAIRTGNRCYLLRMDESISELIRRMEQSEANNATLRDPMTFSFSSAEEATLVDLGFNINVMCSNLATYWAKMGTMTRKAAEPEQDITVIVTDEGTVIIIISSPPKDPV
ncbi:uncharacterized protein ACNLHF_001660 [Anomaloglossus baeobatrachus]|uniref:uncharacterized protein LOC142256263 n=1 Tax=Anomaloglossus baeobatrachus TaxID=238106 RepID=UPI003F503CA7